MALNIPDVDIIELSHALGVLPPSADDIMVIMGNSSDGPLYTAAPYNQIDGAAADFGEGDLVEEAARAIQDSDGTPVYLMRLPNSTPGSNGAIDLSEFTGSSTPTIVGVPFGDYEAWFKVISGGTVGDPAVDITFQWSLNDGRNRSEVLSLSSSALASAGSEISDADTFPLASLVDGDTLLGKVDQQAVATTMTVRCAPATKTGAGATYAAVTAGHQLVVQINGVAGQQAITFAGTENTQTLFHSKANQQLEGAYLANAAGQTKLWTSDQGSGAGGSIVSGDADVLASLGLSVGVLVNAGPNTIVSKDAVTAAQFAALLTTNFTGGTAGSTGSAVGSDSVQWESNTAGLSPNGVQFTGGTILAKIAGFDSAEHNGTATVYSFSFPRGNIGLTFDAGDLNDGDIIRWKTIGPKWVSGNLTTAFNVLAGGQQDFGFLQITGPVSGTEATNIGDGLDKLRLQHKFKWAIWNARAQDEENESEAEWAADLIADYASFHRDDVAVCAGTGWVTSAISGDQMARPICGSVCGRLVKVPLHIDAGKARDGALPAITLYDSSLNRIAHDEDKAPLLAAKRFVVLRTFDGLGTEVYINNPMIMSVPGSDFQFIQHRRVMNVLERTVYVFGVTLDLGLEGTVNELGFVSETAARDIDEEMRIAIKTALGPAISNPDDEQIFQLSRTDPVLTNGGELNAASRIQPLFYIKRLKVKTGFTATAQGG